MSRLVGLLCALVVGFSFPMPVAAERGGPMFGPAQGDELHVMSFNLRFAAPDGPHSWPRRRPVMAALLRRELPTVFGTQEGLHGQLTDIAADLPSYYAWIGEGRGGGTRDEYVAIFYDTRRLVAVSSGHFWLSDTPAVPASRSWGNETVRMATWVRFADQRTGAEFMMVNTHFDNHSENSRVRGAELIRDRIADVDVPVILTGDFNAAPDSGAYRVLVRDGGMADTWLTAAERTPLYATWHGYHDLTPGGTRIDWMLTRGAVEVRAAGINTFADEGEYPSDHLPIQALLTLGR
jgi:endonuclease/exonuclease/phosphatase family metal-dependent hydrolase